MNREDFPRKLTIQWLREQYVQKAITPEEVVREIIDRANVDREMNIWITPPSMEVIAPYLNNLTTLDPATSPLWGIPFAIKDNIDLAGIPTTAACPEYQYIPEENAIVVERLIAAGAIPLGKTNLDQFATGLVGTRSPYGETHNSLNKDLISGGSSSGSAVAVARGHAVFALGTDTAGSGRVPAALNNLVGFKPSIGAWPVKGVVPACASLDCVTVFAHNLEDTLAVDAIVRGIADGDPWSREMPQLTFKLPQKICLPKEPIEFFGPYANEYARAWDAAIARVRKLNIPIEYIDYQLFAEAAAILYEGPWVAERWADLGDFIDAHPEAIFPISEQVLRSGAAQKHNAASVFHAIHKLQSLKLSTRKLLDNAVMVMPTSGGTWTREQVRQNPISTNSDMGRYTNHCNLLDLCAVAIPTGAAAANIPFGITLFALNENESLIYATADLLLKSSPNTTLIAVCGLHMRGYPLEDQMRDLGAKFIGEGLTAAKYRLIKLPTVPAKPGLIKHSDGGASITVEIWEMPIDAFGVLTASIPAPLGIGKIELLDGVEVPGFICEAYAAGYAEDITAFGSWRKVSFI